MSHKILWHDDGPHEVVSGTPVTNAASDAGRALISTAIALGTLPPEAQTLAADDFVEAAHCVAWRLCRDLHDRQEPITPHAIAMLAAQQGVTTRLPDGAPAGWAEKLAAAHAVVPAQVPQLVAIVRAEAARRKIERAATEAICASRAGRPVEAIAAALTVAAASTAPTETAAEVLPSVCVDLTQAQPEDVTYSWENYIALGESTLITAMPGVGKTLMVEEIMAAISVGRRLPGNHFARKPAHSILVNYEDSITKSVLPRLIAAGADPKMVHPLDFEKVALSLPDGWAIIEAEIGRYGAELCVIDPIQGFFDEKHSSNNDAQTRAVLRPGIAIARKHNCAMVFIRHSNKLQGANAMAKGGGSIGFTGVARWEFMLGTSDAVDDEDTRILACVKTNFKRPPSRAFKIVDVGGVPKIEWLGEVAITADELASQGPSMRKGEKLEKAIESILATLADGQWHRSEEVMANAKKGKIGERTIKAAKAQLKDDDKIENRLVGPKGEQSWWCRLLAEPTTTVQPEGAS
ncbi:MAG: AAA family ATPase, partial [Polyangia bacterium]